MLQAQSFFDNNPLCKEIGSMNVSFDDDLFVLNVPTSSSMRLIRNVLKRFGNVSGLHPNLSKSTSYSAGVPDQEVRKHSDILGIPISSLLVRSRLVTAGY
ncbi:hypothetical protein LIER_20971 [Lithospermum erythrorhizon]